MLKNYLLDLAGFTAVLVYFLIDLVPDIVEITFDTKYELFRFDYGFLGACIVKSKFSRCILASKWAIESKYVLVIVERCAHDRPKEVIKKPGTNKLGCIFNHLNRELHQLPHKYLYEPIGMRE